MSPLLLFSFVIGYFLILLAVAWYTGRNSDNHSFFIGNKNSNWMLVAFGMVGTSLSGVTFVSVPGAVAKESFAYLQITIGYLFGYLMIAYILLPLYYKLNLTSIYNYLSSRMGFNSYKTGSSFFILSRTLGATARLYLVVNILQEAILNSFNVPFWATTLIILVMILLYTFEGGVKTIVYTDTLQTTCMLAGLVICVFYILNQLNMGFGDSLQAMNDRGYSKIFFTDPNSKFFFLKQIIAGAFITVTMTGMDQEMMQKNISVKTLKDSQKNVMSMAITLATVIVIFLFLGGLLYLYAENLNIAVSGDKIFPVLAMEHMPPVVSVIFIIALISALFPSADGAITALTSTFCIDIIGIQRRADLTEAAQKKIRQRVHLTFAAIFLVFVLIFKWVNDPSMIGLLLKIAAYTYGPLLGLFTFGIITKRIVNDALVPYVCIAAPIICFILDKYQKSLLGSYEVGLELLIINGSITFLGLLLISKKGNGTN
ncbi:sodium:solute symporter [Sediminibacterium sp.]|uniref:sodium:solute symporter n=1 Tax=Sediminibacterium sp. TaxID=1917865 RepID=UPI0027375BF5|nr:sodium:solute symporter [Sediminibacterium sp.]MDP3394972.1 sodium:solute symporter [Sediminibacterium sp.]MDP3565598.1 sodium:solute symporter [Sediminibacterium sp.]